MKKYWENLTVIKTFFFAILLPVVWYLMAILSSHSSLASSFFGSGIMSIPILTSFCLYVVLIIISIVIFIIRKQYKLLFTLLVSVYLGYILFVFSLYELFGNLDF
jgi:hypothetical protein